MTELELYVFRPYPYVFEAWRLLREKRLVLEGPLGEAVVSLESGAVVVYLMDNRVETLEASELDERKLYLILAEGRVPRVVPAEVRGRRLYARLHVARAGSTPTLLLNGVLMHRVVDIDPLVDAGMKVRAAKVRRGAIVLDVCTGLGYTAVSALRRGASRVYTVELSREILALAEANPASRGLADPRVRIVRGNAVDVVGFFRDEFFTNIVHDPPRFNLAGELYSQEFYRELYRVLRPGGVLFHYTGEPLHSRGRGHGPVVRGVIERLRAAGFNPVWFEPAAQGVIARKPR